MAPKTILDTDILSALMRRTPVVLNRARSYSADHSKLTLSLITRYEILRGLKAKNAITQSASFNVFCANNEVLLITEQIIIRASDIYADLHRRGQLIGDADILIASTAIEHGLVLATNNVAHFRRISGLQIDNWLT